MLYYLFIYLNVIYQFSIFFFSLYEKKKKQLERLKEQLHKLELQITDKEENKDIALGTSKLNYLDPRISVAWLVKIIVYSCLMIMYE